MIRNIYYSNVQPCMRYGFMLWCQDNESNTVFKWQKIVLRIISSVSNPTSCRQRIYYIRASLYILELVSFIKRNKDFMAKNLDIHNDKWRKLNLHVQHCNTVPFKKSVINNRNWLQNCIASFGYIVCGSTIFQVSFFCPSQSINASWLQPEPNDDISICTTNVTTNHLPRGFRRYNPMPS
jgi:hypothetical protein